MGKLLRCNNPYDELMQTNQREFVQQSPLRTWKATANMGGRFAHARKDPLDKATQMHKHNAHPKPQ